jgi:hypothetical protein
MTPKINKKMKEIITTLIRALMEMIRVFIESFKDSFRLMTRKGLNTRNILKTFIMFRFMLDLML